MDIKQDHYNEGLAKKRGKRANHKSTCTLLEVPWYSDLLDDQDNEDETRQGRLLINSAKGFQTEMAKWITALRVAEAAEDVEAWEEIAAADSARDGLQAPAVPNHTKWKAETLEKLFGGQAQPPSQMVAAEVDAEAALMQALAEMEEDERLDDGEIEIPSEDEYNG